MTVKCKLDSGAFLPKRAHPDDAGLDIRCPRDVILIGGQSLTIDSGVHVEIPHGYVGIVKARSSYLSRDIDTDGVIDPGYTGSIKVHLISHADGSIRTRITRGEKIAQLLIVPCFPGEMKEVEELQETERGDGGFGSTGR